MSVDRDELTAEKEFLLRSLDDLDAELEAGNIDEGTYRVLRHDYTARAAAVIHSLDDRGERPAPEPSSGSPALRVATVVGIVVFCLAGAFLLAQAAGDRRPGQTITGNDQARTPTTLGLDTYEGRVRGGVEQLAAEDYLAAIDHYTAANRIDPSQPEPLASRGWVSGLVAQRAGDDADARQVLIERALIDLDAAIALDESYANAYFFKGYVLARIANRPADAVAPLQRFLTLTPQDHPLRNEVLAVLAEAEQANRTQP